MNSDSFANRMLEKNIDIFHYDILDDGAIDLLKTIVESTNSEIVLSSSWRWYKESREKIREQLQKHNLKFIDITPTRTDKTLKREEEIQNWLDSHPEVVNYVILDDEKISCESMKKHHVRTTFSRGLTIESAQTAIEILNRS